MKLAKLRIENFRQLGSATKPFELDFTDALGRVREFTLLVGPNGCGKTTILDAIAAAIGPNLEMPTLRPGFKRSPRTVVPRGALHAKVTCWLRFDPAEIDTAREVFRLAERDDFVLRCPGNEAHPDVSGSTERIGLRASPSAILRRVGRC